MNRTFPQFVAQDPHAVAAAAAALAAAGAVVLRSALGREEVDRLARAAEACYATLRPAERHPDRAATDRRRFVPSASSFGLDGLEVVAGMHAARWLAGRASIRCVAARVLGAPVAVDLDRSWLRRQYAPARYPPGHAPHSWHQDGALGFDFAKGDANGPDALLPMLACWCPLVRCGTDAPGLELVHGPLAHVVPLAGLADAAVRRAFAAERFQAPQLDPGDALLIAPGTLHRTHVTNAMSRDRTSVEVRLFAAGRTPARLAGDRFVVVPEEGG